jgi:UDP-N-acetylglucosamine/UDP-N-acetylgalactosamine 4-epimerase
MYQHVRFHPEGISLANYRFLITGGAGFIGSHLVEYLLTHGAARVVAVDNLSEGRRSNLEAFKEHPAFEFVEANCCNADIMKSLLKDVDFVSHQAALGSVPRSIKTPLATNEANVTGFLTVLNAAREAGVRRMVYASSSSVYGDHPTLPKTEDVTGKLLSPYAVSKMVNELYADVFHRTYGMEVLGLRYFNIFGPRQKPDGPYAAVIPLFIDAIRNNKPVYINGDGLQTRDFTYVENAVQANIKALFTEVSGACGKVFNIAVGERATVLGMYNQLRVIAGSGLDPVHREDREGDIRDSLADISLAQKYLGYAPMVKLDEGLRRTFDGLINA